MVNKIALEAKSIFKSFYDPVKIDVLKDISFNIKRGEFVSVTGKSGCGKSTLLYILSTMDSDYTGELIIDNELMSGKTEKQLALVRNERIGFVFQFHYLLNEFSVLKNVMLPGFKLNKFSEELLENNAYDLLKKLGIEKLAKKMAYQISGGEKQRVAIARAMINDPLILMCDEPTGNLDSKNTEIVFDIFNELVNTFNKALLIVTHDQNFAKNTHRTIVMEDGRILK
ncbi:ABC transporter ATP-binding protein [Marivirga salinae]|uniref:ABC transporter ATP-binding protein n=1 Tax=Marivirga salinarum TaxID=3059078 RepID=A0AA49GC63_9BACT|nr:ABC transporter ATP-binding protein [Marivirga sp. BDSF4-3]WKK77018.2 ABC transporter ATP-binding protein [Marivirga sp. BDSF4-3]